MKLYMLWDMEGVSALLTRQQVWYWEEGVTDEERAEGLRLVTADASAAARAALEAGADEVIAVDAHHGGHNIHLEEVFRDPRIAWRDTATTDAGEHSRWMPDLDESVDAFLLMGHHAKARTKGAFLPHTWTGDWADVRINGTSVGEMALEACYAGHWDVPVALAHGDDHACAEAEALFPGIVTAPVKRAESFAVAAGLPEGQAHDLVADRIAEAIRRVRAGECSPYRPELPMTVTIDLKKEPAVLKALERPGVERVGELTVQASLQRHCDVLEWILGVGLDLDWQGAA